MSPERVERPDTENAPEMLAERADSVVIVTLVDVIDEDDILFSTLSPDRVERPDTEKFPEIFAVLTESVVMTEFGVYRKFALIVF